MGTKELEKSTKIKIFKELATNTELLENGKPLKSEVELSVEMSRILSNKMGTGSSLDSLVQHVYNLDKPCNATLSTATIDPMENKLEREYRKIFSNQSKDCACNKKISAANSDSLLRRFEALRRDMSLKDELKKNISKTSSPNEAKYKDASVDSDRGSLPENDDKKVISPITSDYSETHKKEKSKKKSKAKLKKSSYWRRSDIDSDHQTKGRFKLWGRKRSIDSGSHKKSKIKCSDSKKKSEASVKFSKLLKSKSSVKKEGKKFHFFKKKIKAAPRSRTDVMTGRCEVREGMSIQIGNGLLPQDYNTNAIQKFRLKYEDKLINAWIRNFLTKSDEPRIKRSTKYSSSVESNCSSSTDIGENSCSETDIQLTTTATVTNNSSFHKVNKSPFMNFSNQYIQAWMLTKTILDRLVKPKIYWNARTDKCNKKKNIDVNKYFECKDVNPKNDVTLNNDINIKEKIIPKPESIMVDISLGCMSEVIHQSFAMQSNEEVCKIIDYETPRQSTANALKQNFEKEKCNEIINESCMKDITNCRFNDIEDIKKIKTSYSADIFQDNELDAPKTCNAVGIEIATQKNLGKLNYPVYDMSTESGDDLEGTVYLVPKTYKQSDVYLRKFYHNWNPLDLDLWCISDTNLQPSYNTNKDYNFKSYSNMTDDIQYTTLVSSGETFGNCGKDKRKKSLLKGHNNDYLNNNIGIRITPKDSLEVCKKRKLYSDSNKGRWKHDDLSVSLSSSTKSKHHFRKFISIKPNKKRVTISNYEVDKESKSILKENDIRKKNLQCLSSSCHVSDSMQTGRKLPKLEKKPTRQNIAITATSSGVTNRTSNNCDNAEVKCLKSASKDHLLSVTDSCITNWKKHLCCDNSLEEEKKTCEKINDTKSGFFSDYFKPSSLIKNKYHSICRKFVADRKSSEESVKNSQNSKCRPQQSNSNLREEIKSEFRKCAITTDVQKLSTAPTSVEDKSCGAPGTDLDMSKKGKLVGLHFKKQPIRKNVSRACWTTGDNIECNNGNSNDTTKVSSKETTGVNQKCPPTTPTVSKKEIKNIIVNKETNNFVDNNQDNDDNNEYTPCIIRKNIEIQPNAEITSDSGKRICLGIDTCNDEQGNDKSDCDFIEIVFKIRCKHGEDRAMIVNIKDSKDRIIKDNKINLCERDSDINSKNKEVYLFQNESGNSILRKNSKNCMNVKILIKNCKNDELKTKDLKGNSNISISSKRITERVESISSETIKAVNNYAYSVHKFTIDLTKSVKSNNASKENYAMLHSNNKGTVMSDIDLQNNAIDSTEINDNRSKGKNKHYNSSKTNDSRKSKHTKIKNEKLYYSSATLRPYRRYSLTKQMSNYKHIKNKVLQKIVDCAKDFNKGIKKEKRIRKGSSVMPSLDYSNRNINDKNVNRLSKEIKASTLYSHFLNATSSYGYCHFDRVVRVRPKSNVNNYLFTVQTKDRHKKFNPYVQKNMRKGKSKLKF
ncbi:hypothetical protein RR46_12619 [Papilio xuthus]|uniref:Uncharacterized protein n=1 Tax=Papilio xuthus TaxID=66420 RepID=A0A194PV11_PAPXU|nr:hypothetical protein RR46_12619 [Papilio xuthus]